MAAWCVGGRGEAPTGDTAPGTAKSGKPEAAEDALVSESRKAKATCPKDKAAEEAKAVVPASDQPAAKKAVKKAAKKATKKTVNKKQG